jgi:hypothetical protein
MILKFILIILDLNQVKVNIEDHYMTAILFLRLLIQRILGCPRTVQ